MAAGVAALLLITPSLSAELPPGVAATAFVAPSARAGTTLFTTVAPDASGVSSENRYADPRMWGQLYHEFEIGPIGTGIAIGDYDGDGRADLFVVSKTESCRLFRNLGNWRFEDVSEAAGVADRGDAAGIWKQGATFADVNNDGRLDLYVCRFGAANLLYVNQGDGTFREQAHAAGLDVTDASTMAAFCDYDRDGWLDVYVQTNLLNNAEHPVGQRDYLFRNTGDGTFSDVTVRAGLSTAESQGNSAAWWDTNGDGWHDLYVANDFAVPDWLYRNNGDGTFTQVIDDVVPHVTYSSMGSDVGDINNDGLLDFLVTDMAATTHEKDQRTMADTRSRTKDPADDNTAVPNYLWNALFLNSGTGRMMEAAHLVGLAATDWTWSVRFEDLDNDGRVDLHVTNGMHREIHNTDLIQRMMITEGAADRVRVAKNSPVLREPNLAYRNTGDLRFEEVGAAWGLDAMGVSFGAAFGDLDGDGDLDLAYTNYENGVSLLRNDCATGERVIIELRGRESNRFGIGAIVRIETESGVQVRQIALARGYMSSSEPIAHFGLGSDRVIRRLEIEWPSGLRQVVENLPAGARYTIEEPEGAGKLESQAPQPTQFVEVTDKRNLRWRATEPVIDEIAQQRLLPVRMNRRGPALAVGDIDHDGRDDVVIGGAALEGARVLLRGTDPAFLSAGSLSEGQERMVNDGPVLIFDANGDDRNDVLITKGGNSLPAGVDEYLPVLYFGAETGLHRAHSDVLPPVAESIAAAVAADFDRDGRLDLFLGARVLPTMYPLSPHSAVLLNRDGRFEDVTAAALPDGGELGMVTSALASDVDQDGWPDLLVAVEWGPVRYLRNREGRGFEDRTEAAGFSTAGSGWWTGLVGADFNRDGRMDYAAGNLGLNTTYRASRDEPAVLYVSEPPDGGSLRLIEGYYENGTLYPRRSRKDMASILPTVGRRFPRNDLYARAPLDAIVGADVLSSAERLVATELRSGVFLSQSNGSYHFSPLPRIAQIAPAQGLVVGDFDADGYQDLYIAQNSYAPTPVVGRADGGLSQLLRGDGRGGFEPVPHVESGLVVPGDAKALVVLDINDDAWPDVLVTRNNATSVAFENRGVEGRTPLRVRLEGPPGNPAAVGARVSVERVDGSQTLAEVRAGSGWCSQSSASLFFGYTEDRRVRNVTVQWPSGRVTQVDVKPGQRKVEAKE